MKRLLLASLLLHPVQALADPLITVSGGLTIVARYGTLDVHDAAGDVVSWPLTEAPTAVAAGGGSIAVASEREITIIRDGASRTIATPSQIDHLVFAGENLWAADRLGGLVFEVRSNGLIQRAALGPDLSPLSTDGSRIFVAARGAAEIVRIDGDAIARTAVPRGVADIEVHGDGVYVAVPASGELLVLDSSDLSLRERFRLGSAPADLAIGGSGTALSAAKIWVADPAHGAVIADEASQSTLAAFTRGFLRGALGLGLARAEVHHVPGRPVRLALAGRSVVTQDLSSGTLWLVGRSRLRELGKAGDGAFATDQETRRIAWIDLETGGLRTASFAD